MVLASEPVEAFGMRLVLYELFSRNEKGVSNFLLTP